MSVSKGIYFSKKTPYKLIHIALAGSIIFWCHNVTWVTFSQCYFPITNFDISTVLKMMVTDELFFFPKKWSGHRNPETNNDQRLRKWVWNFHSIPTFCDQYWRMTLQFVLIMVYHDHEFSSHYFQKLLTRQDFDRTSLYANNFPPWMKIRHVKRIQLCV